ncbi:MAG: oligosaccharide flippase family protein [Bacteroidota bacterium]|nr:oligosaccharide flippase family protein [Bacteroidota bacterium]
MFKLEFKDRPFLIIARLIRSRYFFNLVTTFLSQATNALSVLLLTPVFLKYLGIQKFGIYGVILNIVTFSAMFDFGLNTGMLRRLIHNKDAGVNLINSVFFFFCLSFFITLPVIAWLHYTSLSTVDKNFLYYILFAAILFTQNILILFFDTIIQTANKIYIGKIVRMLKLMIEFVCLYLLSKYESIIYLLLVSCFLNFIYAYILFFLSKKEVGYTISFHSFRFPVLYDHFKYSFWYFLNSIANVLVFNAQVIMISALMGSTQVAKYLVVTRFFDIIRIGMTNFTQVLFPSLAVMEANGDWIRIKKTFWRTFLGILLLVLLAFPILFIWGQKVFILWSKQSDAEIVHLYLLFSAFILLIVLDNVSAIFLAALKLNKSQTVISILQGCIGLLLGLSLMKYYGVAGMVIASITALLLTNLIFNPVFLLRKINFRLSV